MEEAHPWIAYNGFSPQIAVLCAVTFCLLCVSALVSGAETSFFSLSHNDVRRLQNSKSMSAAAVLRLLTDVDLLLATILVVNNLVNICIVILTAGIIDSVFTFLRFEFLFKTVLVTFLLLLFGEILPKVLAQTIPLRFASMVARPLLVLLQVPEATMEGALAYLTLILLCIPLTMAYNMEAALLRAIGNSLTPLYFLLFSTVLNIGLDIAFMGPLQLGVGGAAAATVVAQGISAVLCGWYIIRNYPALHFTHNAFANGKKFAANMFWAGLSMGLMSAIYNIGSVVLQSSINALGSTYIAAQVAARRFAELFFIPGSALGIAVATYSSQNLGAGRRSRIMKGVTTALGIYFVWWVFVMLFVFFLSDPAVRAITGTNDEVIISNAVLYLKISAPVVPPMAVLVIVRNMLQGIQHTIEPLLASGLELIGKVIFGVWIVPAVGYTAVCFCEPVTWVICFVFILGALYRCRGELKDKE